MTKILAALKDKAPAEFRVNTYSLTLGFLVIGVAAAAAMQLAVQTFGA